MPWRPITWIKRLPYSALILLESSGIPLQCDTLALFYSQIRTKKFPRKLGEIPEGSVCAGGALGTIRLELIGISSVRPPQRCREAWLSYDAALCAVDGFLSCGHAMRQADTTRLSAYRDSTSRRFQPSFSRIRHECSNQRASDNALSGTWDTRR